MQRVDYLGGKDCTWCSENDGRTTVSRARMFALARSALLVSSRPVSVTRPQVSAVADVAPKWVAIASAIVTKLPLNMLTPDTGVDSPVTKDARQRCDSTTAARF